MRSPGDATRGWRIAGRPGEADLRITPEPACAVANTRLCAAV
jgi:hypothetical protein